MDAFRCSYGNEYDSYQSIEYKPKDGFNYTAIDKLSGVAVSLSQDLVANLEKVLNSLPPESILDASIGVNPAPGERHYDSRNSLYIKLQSGTEYKFLADDPPSEELKALLIAIKKIFEHCAQSRRRLSVLN